MSCKSRSVISQTVQVENVLRLGTTVVRFYQYISDLLIDNREVLLTTDDGNATLDGVIQTLEQFSRDIDATNPTITVRFLSPGLFAIVGRCQRDCDSLRNSIETWRQFCRSERVLQLWPEPLLWLSGIIAKCYGCITDEPGGDIAHWKRQQHAVKRLLSTNQYAQATLWLSNRI